MPIDRIPILAEDYPLFDWDDHLQSYYALGEGELVAGFQKETWNAIIDKTKELLSAAGMSWDSSYTTAAAAKITEAYGALSAEMFNSVRHNIDLPAPVGWGWAKNPNMRGYVGRNDFKGYADYGLNGDYFYAEYLLELVHRLNLLTSIMRGTANLSDMAGPVMAQTETVRNLLSLPSAPMEFSDPAFSSFICVLQANSAGQFSYIGSAKSKEIVTAVDLPAKRLNVQARQLSLHKAKQAMPAAIILKKYRGSTPSISQAAMDIFNCLYLSSAYGLAKSTDRTTLAVPPLYRFEAKSKAVTEISATGHPLLPHRMEGTDIAVSSSQASGASPWVIRSQGKVLSKAEPSTNLGKLRLRRMYGKRMSETSCIAVLDSAWYAPIWVNGKLYIRQAYETNQTDATLEVK